jgi:hypothetical protein
MILLLVVGALRYWAVCITNMAEGNIFVYVGGEQVVREDVSHVRIDKLSVKIFRERNSMVEALMT